MFICKICGHKGSRGSGHIKSKHDISTLEYVKIYENIDVIFLYSEGFSAKQIADKIKQKNIGINPIKNNILSYLKENNIEIRKTSEATKCWVDKKGGVWNKGLTKEEHPSILKYSNSRIGKNNGYYTGPESSRLKTKWWLNKTEEEIENIRKKTGDTIKQLHKEGKIKLYDPHSDPLWREKWENGYKKYLQSEHKHKFGNPSLAEKEIATFLEELNIRYISQYNVAERYNTDFFLPELNMIIEYYGSYWHCDPRKYEKDFYNQKKKKTAEEIWQYDKQREQSVISQGYKYIVIWESDYKVLTTFEKREMIRETIENQKNNKTTD
jgi:G:T-mismatch repair DNA endonuclease (very short patch repair protein)